MGSDNLGYSVRRWRQCAKCYYKFFTLEIPEEILENADELAQSLQRG